MNLEKYKRAWGKLSKLVAINVDEQFYSVVECAKKNKFDFNGWARDTLAERLPELQKYLEQSK